MARRTAKPRPEEAAKSHRESLRRLREILFANIVMAGEIPAPTGGEGRMARFLSDRFTECGLTNISIDQAGNVAGIVTGGTGSRTLLVAAHIDKIWSESEDHTVSVGAGVMSGRGLADNSLGVAVLATLPLVLEELGIVLEGNLVLLGTTGSFGRGNLSGMRFFLDNAERPVDAALCLEGIELGRISHSSLGMARGEIVVESPRGPEGDGEEQSSSLAVSTLAEIVSAMLSIHRRETPETRILIGSIEAGSGHSVPPRSGVVRFEVRSRDADRVARVEAEISELVRTVAGRPGLAASLETFAYRSPGDLGGDHPLVKRVGEIHRGLGIESRVSPSVSELALLLERRIPSLTLGLTRGENRHSPEESICLDPLLDGLAQIVAVLQFMDEVDPTF